MILGLKAQTLFASNNAQTLTSTVFIPSLVVLCHHDMRPKANKLFEDCLSLFVFTITKSIFHVLLLLECRHVYFTPEKSRLPPGAYVFETNKSATPVCKKDWRQIAGCRHDEAEIKELTEILLTLRLLSIRTTGNKLTDRRGTQDEKISLSRRVKVEVWGQVYRMLMGEMWMKFIRQTSYCVAFRVMYWARKIKQVENNTDQKRSLMYL